MDSYNNNGLRLAKFLAQAGVASRRQAEVLIKAGKVKVNGKQIREVVFFVDPEKDKVQFEKKSVSIIKDDLYLILNKPKGYVSTHKAQKGQKTVFDLLDKKYKNKKLIIVGRLDKESRGLILLTNDGELAHKLMHPKFLKEKEYIVKLRGIIKENLVLKLKKGVMIEGGFARAKFIEWREKNTLRIVLTEGKKRQIRLMIEKLGYVVQDLFRTLLGPLKLGKLRTGESRELTEREIKLLKRIKNA
jgi:23S rRNA pseudouridine2605 synthase